MKCIRQVLCITLLVCLALSPAYCGWDAFKNSSSGFSTDASTSLEETTPETPMEALSETSQTEVETESAKIEKNSTDYAENSEDYEENLDAVKDVLNEAEAEVKDETGRKAEKKKDAIEEAKAIVEDLTASKAALDENYNILADVALRQEKEIRHLQRQESFKFGLGFVTGYKWLDTITLGVGTHFLFNEEWDVGIEATYDVHALGGLDQFKNPAPENLEIRVGVTKYF